MKRVIVPLITATLLLTACNTRGSAQQVTSQGDSADEGRKAAQKSVTADVSGDRTAMIKAVGDLAGVSVAPSEGKTLVTINGSQDDGADKGVTVTVVAGTPPMATLTQGSTTIENGVGSVSFRPASGKSEFSTMFDHLFYATPKHADAAATVTFTKVIKLSAENHIARYRLVGSFSFDAATNPEPVSQPCAVEAAKAAGRTPMYSPTLCGAQRVRVTGRFDSTADVLEM